MNDLLTEPLFSLRIDGSAVGASLPGVLASLSRGADVEYLRVRPYQEQGWHCFLVQLAAFAMDRSGVDAPWVEEARWREQLLELSGGPEAWQLVVDDLRKPAFMQAPIPEGRLGVLKDGPIQRPDDSSLDLLFTTRGHDLKGNRFAEPSAEHWVHTLISLQTLAAFGGRSNYGVIRMNGGYGSRPMVGLALPWAQRFAHDTAAWRTAYEGPGAARFDRAEGIGLLWTVPWSGKKSATLATSALHPAFIEVCRRVRLAEAEGNVVAFRVGTEAPRVDGKLLNGVTGDAWTPVNSEGKSLTVKGGFAYSSLHTLLFGGEWQMPASVTTTASDRPSTLEFRALEGGQGETAGFHLRRVDVPKKAMAGFGMVEEDQRFALRSAFQIELVKAVARSALRPAIAALLQGGADELDLRDDRIRPVLQGFERRVDAGYFEQLFRSPTADPEDHQAWFGAFLEQVAKGAFESATKSLPIPDARRERALAAAESLFRGGLRKHIRPNPKEPEEHDAA